MLPNAVSAPRVDPGTTHTRSLTLEWPAARSDAAPVDKYEVDVLAWGSSDWVTVSGARPRAGEGGL